MIKLIFQSERIPRTTTRAEWRRMWQWKRSTERIMDDIAERNREAINKSIEEVLIYGHSTIKIDIDGMINPAIMIYPQTTEPFEIDLRPGALNIA